MEWLRKAHDLSPERQAAALVLADTYIARLTWVSSELLSPLGVLFRPSCPGETAYTHSLLGKAVELSPSGPAGELARVAYLEYPCYFEGKQDWRDGRIRRAEDILREWPRSQWVPYVHQVLARTYEAKLLLYYPAGDPEGQTLPSERDVAPRLRTAAIDHFRAFLESKPSGSDGVLAWDEAWRLLAGLPPQQIHFGCGCE